MANPILTARIVHCSFGRGNNGRDDTYAYYTEDETIKEGDLAVVVAPRNSGLDAFSVCRPMTKEERDSGHPQPPNAPIGYAKIVRVVSTEETVVGIENVREWIVCKLDFADYCERRSIEEKRKVINAKIKRAVAEAREQLDLEDLASRSPALKALLEEAAKI